jgi:hypothetical protein
VTQGTDSPDRMRPPHDLHEKLMQLVLQAEVPCMKWREIPSGVGSVIAIPPDIDGPDRHDPRAQLQHWAGRQLSQLHREAGPPLVHQQILRAAAQRKVGSSEDTFASSLYSQKGLRYKDIISFIPDEPRAGPFPIRFRSPLPRLDPNGGALSFPLRTSREASHMLQCCLSWLRTIPWPGIG